MDGSEAKSGNHNDAVIPVWALAIAFAALQVAFLFLVLR